ncbi:MAG: hypothetical protein UHH87_03450, partial [Akkermansia sp.]|nr:hypothetical protein [Akkermansia sp.]
AGLPLSFIFYPLARAQNSAGVRPRIRKINYNLRSFGTHVIVFKIPAAHSEKPLPANADSG